MPSPTFTGKYAKDGKDDRAKVRAESGHRCIRCGHPYETGLKRADKGEWSVCDEQCTHKGDIRVWVSDEENPHWWETESLWPVNEQIAGNLKIEARWRILTVHHFDGNKANDAWWNKLALCQRCHLQVQTKVNPEIPYMFEHSDWLKPYVAGFYAAKYLNEDLTREEVMPRLEELLKLERKA